MAVPTEIQTQKGPLWLFKRSGFRKAELKLCMLGVCLQGQFTSKYLPLKFKCTVPPTFAGPTNCHVIKI